MFQRTEQRLHYFEAKVSDFVLPTFSCRLIDLKLEPFRQDITRCRPVAPIGKTNESTTTFADPREYLKGGVLQNV